MQRGVQRKFWSIAKKREKQKQNKTCSGHWEGTCEHAIEIYVHLGNKCSPPARLGYGLRVSYQPRVTICTLTNGAAENHLTEKKGNRQNAEIWSNYLKSKSKPSQNLLHTQRKQCPHSRTTPKQTALAAMCDNVWQCVLCEGHSGRSGTITSHGSSFGITHKF